MASMGKMYESPLAALTGDYPSTLTSRMCEGFP